MNRLAGLPGLDASHSARCIYDQPGNAGVVNGRNPLFFKGRQQCFHGCGATVFLDRTACLMTTGCWFSLLIIWPGLFVTGVQQAFTGVDSDCLAFKGTAFERNALGFEPAAVFYAVVTIKS
ncbi:hypothetical protein D3C78_997570 [compost metagenome]